MAFSLPALPVVKASLWAFINFLPLSVTASAEKSPSSVSRKSTSLPSVLSGASPTEVQKQELSPFVQAMLITTALSSRFV